MLKLRENIKRPKLDREYHVYTVDGIKYPGVTEILKSVGLSSYDSRFVSEEDRARGRILHQCIHFMNEGDLDFNTVSAEMEGPLIEFAKFMTESKIKVLMSEVSLYSSLGFCGTLDAVAELPGGEIAVLDWKSGQPGKEVCFQLALYAQLLSENTIGNDPWKIGKGVVSHIMSGKPKLNFIHSAEDHKIAMAAVAVHAAKLNRGII